MARAGRSLVLVPSESMRGEIAKDVEENLGFATFSAQDIKETKRPFVDADSAVAIVANRYDGIDFPGPECRFLFIEGLPSGDEVARAIPDGADGCECSFQRTRPDAGASGRCTRSLEDFSAVVVSGEELPDYLADVRRRRFVHPELQAELMFGIEQSKGISLKDMRENFDTFLANGEEWEEVNQQIVEARKHVQQEPFPAMDNLRDAVRHEVDYQSRMWQSDYESALASAEHILAGLKAPELRGYRALCHYLAGSAARLGSDAGVVVLAAKARVHFERAKDAAIGIPWLVKLARYQADALIAADQADHAIVMEQIEKVEAVLAGR